jgi:hypothetical protein
LPSYYALNAKLDPAEKHGSVATRSSLVSCGCRAREISRIEVSAVHEREVVRADCRLSQQFGVGRVDVAAIESINSGVVIPAAFEARDRAA